MCLHQSACLPYPNFSVCVSVGLFIPCHSSQGNPRQYRIPEKTDLNSLLHKCGGNWAQPPRILWEGLDVKWCTKKHELPAWKGKNDPSSCLGHQEDVQVPSEVTQACRKVSKFSGYLDRLSEQKTAPSICLVEFLKREERTPVVSAAILM